VIEEMLFFELVERHPDELFVEGRIELDLKPARDFRRRCLPIATTPNERRGAIEAMRLIALEVVNQNFIGQVVNDQSLFTHPG
jgi:hypothetical protein